MRAETPYVFLSFSETPWDGPWYVRQKLMSELSRHHRVIYVTPREDARILLRDLTRRGKVRRGIRRPHPDLLLVEGPILFPRFYRWKKLDRFVDRLFHLFIRWVSLWFGRGRKKVLYLWDPKFSDHRAWYGRLDYVYHAYDLKSRYLFASPATEGSAGTEPPPLRHGKRVSTAERDLILGARWCYAVSRTLCDVYEEDVGRRPELLLNGVDQRYFEAAPPEVEKRAEEMLRDVPVRRIAYSGSLMGALDLAVVDDAARRLTDYTFVFIGPLRRHNIPYYDREVDRILGLPNVRHLGAVDIELLPPLLRRMDFLTLLYRQNRDLWTYYSGPAKLFEYMAVGKPILSTPHPAAEEFAHLIEIVENGAALAAAVRAWEDAPDRERVESLVREAKRYLWRNQVNRVLGDLEESPGAVIRG